jgi:hypothetical protein
MDESSLLKHIQYNFLNKLRNVDTTLKRIDIKFVSSLPAESIIMDKSSAVIYISVDELKGINLLKQESFKKVYKIIFDKLIVVWEKNEGGYSELLKIQEEIDTESYRSVYFDEKNFKSPKKKFKVQFFCELTPKYAEYYLIVNSKGLDEKRIHFLTGIPDVLAFFLFFNSVTWKSESKLIVSDFNKEIHFQFDLDNLIFSTEITPLYSSLLECENRLKSFDPTLKHSERLKLMGVPA